MSNTTNTEKQITYPPSPIEEIIIEPRVDLFKSLEKKNYWRFDRLKSILQKAGFFAYDLGLEIVIDPFMPLRNPYASGSWDLNKTIAINPFFALFASVEYLAYVILHEGVHAGVFTKGVPVLDESVTDFLARKKASESMSIDIDKFRSGYDDLVGTLERYFGDLSFDEIVELIAKGNKETLVSLLAVLAIEAEIANGSTNFAWDEIQQRIRTRWQDICRLFPRLLQLVEFETDDPTEINLFGEYLKEPENYLLDSVLEKASERLTIYRPETLYNIISNLDDGFVSKEEIIEALIGNGYAYICDFNFFQLNSIIDMYLEDPYSFEKDRIENKPGYALAA